MSQKLLALLLKAAIVTAFLCCVFVYAVWLPVVAEESAIDAPEFAPMETVILISVELTGLPLLIAMILAWCIAVEIGRDNSFSRRNASLMKGIAFLALADVVYFVVLINVLAVKGIGSGPLMLASLFIAAFGLMIAVCAGALSHLILKAAILWEENDLTV